MSQSQSHPSNLWSEPAGSGATPTLAAVYLVASGSDVVPSLSGPAGFQFVDVAQDGDYTLLNLAPVYLVNDGSGNAVPSSSGPAAFVLADDGAGGILVTSDLTRAPIADLLYDTGGDLWLVRRVCPRLEAVQVCGDVIFY